jgi:very-short-patch-repair endonuclease
MRTALTRREIAEGRVVKARDLRRRMTPAEGVLWAALRDRALVGVKFRRQHVMGPYVVDFCCPAGWLVVEIDGDGHDEEERRIYDGARTEYLNAAGYRVVRFRNEEVMNDLAGVLERIVDELGWTGVAPNEEGSLAMRRLKRTSSPAQRSPSSPTLLPSEGEGSIPQSGAAEFEATPPAGAVPPLPRKGEGVRG